MAAIALQKNLQYSAETGLELRPYNSPLVFRDITPADIQAINEIVTGSRSFTCDYTLGGIYMWIDYFNYKFCIYNDTLFISGVEENRLDRMAFSCPVGRMPLPQAIALLKEYCDERDIPLQFSAVPADCLTCFTAFDPASEVEELADWSDYVYDAESFATLSGKKMSKKRNHVNRFMADHPEAVFEPLTAESAAALIPELVEWESGSETEEGESATHDNELRQVIDILGNFKSYPFVGGVLSLSPEGKAVGFSIAEVIGDVAFVHIEKMNHEIAGAGETLAHLMVKYMMEKYPALKYLNREEDCGDEGLRHAKESWHPLMLLKKYNVLLSAYTR